jgi:outer membrane protein OmpA-like peptidoglycan-associated protein
MKGIRLLLLAAASLVVACATQAPPVADLKRKLDRVYEGDHGEWLQHEAAADRNLDVAHRAMRHMEQDHYWNIKEMQKMADTAAADALEQRKKAEQVHMRILDKRLRHLDSIHVDEQHAVMAAKAIALFRTGSSSPSKVDHAAVREVAATLKKYPVGFAEVRGYTDTVGNEEANRRLAAARAQAVANVLRQQGVERVHAHVVAIGVGEAGGPPNTPNQENRRVDVMVFPHGKAPQ